MNDTPAEKEGKIRCDLCGRFFQAVEVSERNRLNRILCVDCMQEEEICGCSDE